MKNEDDLQREMNMHLRRNVVFTYLDTKYNASLNLTRQYIASIKVLDGKDDMDYPKFQAIEKYLKQEGFFDINQK
jgi:hypothetical protein